MTRRTWLYIIIIGEGTIKATLTSKKHQPHQGRQLQKIQIQSIYTDCRNSLKLILQLTAPTIRQGNRNMSECLNNGIIIQRKPNKFV